MGKGKRSRDNKAIEAVNNAAAPETKNSVTTWTKVMMIAVALILVASIALIFIQSSGILLRAPSAFSSENYTINGAMMQYLFKTQYNDFYNFYCKPNKDDSNNIREFKETLKNGNLTNNQQ